VYRRFQEVSDFVSAAKNFDQQPVEKTDPKSPSPAASDSK